MEKGKLRKLKLTKGVTDLFLLMKKTLNKLKIVSEMFLYN